MTTPVAFPPRRISALGAGTADPSVLYLAKYAEIETVGRRSGMPYVTTVCFAWAQHAVYVLAHPRRNGARADWYRNALAAGEVMVAIGPVRLYAVPVPAADEACARRLVTGLLRHKYGDYAVTNWHTGTGATPLRLDIIGVALDSGTPSSPTFTAAESLVPVGSP
jgi:deazaflavin-dependent oxidoreductase (nitroreductase family)